MSDIRNLPRISPSRLAEQAYQAARAARGGGAPRFDGLPDDRAVYRPTLDGPWLTSIAGKAAAAWRAMILPEHRRAAVAALLTADLDARFPPADMAILERYRAGRAVTTILVDYAVPSGQYLRPVYVEIERRWLPDGVRYFAPVIEYPDVAAAGLPVPAGARLWFRDSLDVEVKVPTAFRAAIGWPGQFKAREGRWPRWSEIWAAFPLIGEHVAATRAAADPNHPPHDVADRGGGGGSDPATPFPSGDAG